MTFTDPVTPHTKRREEGLVLPFIFASAKEETTKCDLQNSSLTFQAISLPTLVKGLFRRWGNRWPRVTIDIYDKEIPQGRGRNPEDECLRMSVLE